MSKLLLIVKAQPPVEVADAPATGQVSFESVPGRATGELPGIHDAPLPERVKFHEALNNILYPNGKDAIAEAFGIPVRGRFVAPGSYEGDANPSTQVLVDMPRDERGRIAPAFHPHLSAYAAALGHLLKQESVGYHNPYVPQSPEEENALEINVGRPFTHWESEALDTRLGKTFGPDSYALIASPGGARVLNFTGLPNDEFMSKAVDTAQPYLAERRLLPQYKAYAAESDLVGNDWEQHPHGEGFEDRIRQAGRSDLYRGLHRIYAPQIASVYREYGQKYGPDAGGDRERAGVLGSETPGSDTDPAGAGLSLEHYSLEPRTVLDPAYQGTAQAGQERDRADKPPRLYYYRAGTPPEPRFRAYVRHQVNLPKANLYDIGRDPENFIARLRHEGLSGPELATALERAIITAGYDGYRDSVTDNGHIHAIFRPIHLKPNGLAEFGKALPALRFVRRKRDNEQREAFGKALPAAPASDAGSGGAATGQHGEPDRCRRRGRRSLRVAFGKALPKEGTWEHALYAPEGVADPMLHPLLPYARYGKASKTLYLNAPAWEETASQFGIPAHVAGVHILAPHLAQHRDILRQIAGNPNPLGLNLQQVPAARQQEAFRRWADTVGDALTRHPVEGFSVVPGVNTADALLRIGRHEGVHREQARVGRGNRSVVDAGAFSAVPHWEKAVEGLGNLGYPARQVADFEIPAYIAAGQHKLLGLEDDEAQSLIRDYVKMLVARHGPEAAKEMFRHGRAFARQAVAAALSGQISHGESYNGLPVAGAPDVARAMQRPQFDPGTDPLIFSRKAIQFFRRDRPVTSATPDVPEGHVRLYRGVAAPALKTEFAPPGGEREQQALARILSGIQSSGKPPSNRTSKRFLLLSRRMSPTRWYSDHFETADHYAKQAGQPGQVYYIDVPHERAREWMRSTGPLPGYGNAFEVPYEDAQSAQVYTQKAIDTTKAPQMEQYLRGRLGVVSPDDLYNHDESRHFILSNGDLTGDTGAVSEDLDHSDYAREALRHAGVIPQQRDPLHDLSQHTGAIRLHLDGGDVNAQMMANLTPAQMRTLGRVARMFKDEGGFYYDLYHPDSAAHLGSGESLAQLRRAIDRAEQTHAERHPTLPEGWTAPPYGEISGEPLPPHNMTPFQYWALNNDYGDPAHFYENERSKYRPLAYAYLQSPEYRSRLENKAGTLPARGEEGESVKSLPEGYRRRAQASTHRHLILRKAVRTDPLAEYRFRMDNSNPYLRRIVALHPNEGEVGSLEWSPKKKTGVHVSNINVQSAHRGKGVGGKLLSMLPEVARAQGVPLRFVEGHVVDDYALRQFKRAYGEPAILRDAPDHPSWEYDNPASFATYYAKWKLPKAEVKKAMFPTILILRKAAIGGSDLPAGHTRYVIPKLLLGGGQSSYTHEVRPVDEAAFAQHILPTLPPEYASNLADYQQLHPEHTHLNLRRPNWQGEADWELHDVGPEHRLLPTDMQPVPQITPGEDMTPSRRFENLPQHETATHLRYEIHPLNEATYQQVVRPFLKNPAPNVEVYKRRKDRPDATHVGLISEAGSSRWQPVDIGTEEELQPSEEFQEVSEYGTPRLAAKVRDTEEENTLRPDVYQALTEADSRMEIDKEAKKNTVPSKDSPLNAERGLARIDTILGSPESPGLVQQPLESEEAWHSMMAHATGKRFVLGAPVRAIEMARDPGIIAVKVSELTPAQQGSADYGLEDADRWREDYRAGRVQPLTTGLFFLWGILSRSLSPYPHESAFIDILRDKDETGLPRIYKYIQAAIHGDFERYYPEYMAWSQGTRTALASNFKYERDPKQRHLVVDYSGLDVRQFPEHGPLDGTPGVMATFNLNAFGRYFLREMGKRAEEGPYAGQVPLQAIHDLMSGPHSGQQLRREWYKLANKTGLDNKVVSFVFLVTGRKDVLVLDRVQAGHLWGQERYGVNVYEGVPYRQKPNGDVERAGIANHLKGLRGLLVYEALEKGLQPAVEEAYSRIGKEPSLGRFHWETWVKEAGQEAGHASIRAIRQANALHPNPVEGVAAYQGKYDTTHYGTRYANLGDPERNEYVLTDSRGRHILLSPEDYQKYQKKLKEHQQTVAIPPRERIMPHGLRTSVFETHPWTDTLTPTQHANLDTYLHALGRKPSEREAELLDLLADGGGRHASVRSADGGREIGKGVGRRPFRIRVSASPKKQAARGSLTRQSLAKAFVPNEDEMAAIHSEIGGDTLWPGAVFGNDARDPDHQFHSRWMLPNGRLSQDVTHHPSHAKEILSELKIKHPPVAEDGGYAHELMKRGQLVRLLTDASSDFGGPEIHASILPSATESQLRSLAALEQEYGKLNWDIYHPDVYRVAASGSGYKALRDHPLLQSVQKAQTGQAVREGATFLILRKPVRDLRKSEEPARYLILCKTVAYNRETGAWRAYGPNAKQQQLVRPDRTPKKYGDVGIHQAAEGLGLQYTGGRTQTLANGARRVKLYYHAPEGNAQEQLSKLSLQLQQRGGRVSTNFPGMEVPAAGQENPTGVYGLQYRRYYDPVLDREDPNAQRWRYEIYVSPHAPAKREFVPRVVRRSSDIDQSSIVGRVNPENPQRAAAPYAKVGEQIKQEPNARVKPVRALPPAPAVAAQTAAQPKESQDSLHEMSAFEKLLRTAATAKDYNELQRLILSNPNLTDEEVQQLMQAYGRSRTKKAIRFVRKAVTDKQPWQMTAEEWRTRKPLPTQVALPDKGIVPYIRTDDGGVYAGTPQDYSHVLLAERLGIPPERVMSGGFLQDGQFEDGGSVSANIRKWAEQGAAKDRITHRKLIEQAMDAGHLISNEVLAAYPELVGRRMKATQKAIPILPPPANNRKTFPYVGMIDYQGIPIAVENLKGSWRTGVNGAGERWQTKMHAHYGCIYGVGAEGADGDLLDCYVADNPNAKYVFVIDQNHLTGPKAGQFDEQKCVCGCNSEEEAIALFDKHHTLAKQIRGKVHRISIKKFKKRIHDLEKGEKITKAIADLCLAS